MKKLIFLINFIFLALLQPCNAMLVTKQLPYIIKLVFKTDLENLEKLISSENCLINTCDQDGKTALWHAANIGNHNVVKTLLASAALNQQQAPTQGTYKNISPLEIAIKNNHKKCIDLLIDAERKNNNNEIIDQIMIKACAHAIKHNQYEHCINFFNQINTSDHCAALLSHAAQKDDTRYLDLCIQKGLNLDVPCDEYNNTALHHACTSGSIECATLLVNSGVNLDSPNNLQETPLYGAAKNGHADCIKLLTQRGATVDAVNNKGLMPIAYAVERNHLDCISQLLDCLQDNPYLNQLALFSCIGKPVESASRNFLVNRKTSTFKIDASDPKSCVICCDDYAHNQLIMKFSCTHTLHYKCAKQLYQRVKKECPMCKGPLPESFDALPNRFESVELIQNNNIISEIDPVGTKRKDRDFEDKDLENEQNKKQKIDGVL